MRDCATVAFPLFTDSTKICAMKSRHHLGSLLATFLSQPQDPALALYAGAGLQAAGLEEEAVAVWSLGDDVNPELRRVKDHPDAPTEVRENSAAADKAMCRHFTRLHEKAIDTFEASTGTRVDRIRRAIWPLTHDGSFAYRQDMQRPIIFYMPDLPATPVVASDRLGSLLELERATPVIRQEYEQACLDNVVGEPYVPASTPGEQWDKLRGTLDWASIHLYKIGAATAFAAHFPRTLEALAAVDLVRVDGNPMEVFFSRLTPKTHIPPHHGLTNTRLTVHLPLIIPEDCSIRVGADTYCWTQGEVFAFDDSFEHEARNGAATDRVVLIFDVHHPDLSPAERSAIEAAYGMRQQWLNQRMNLLARSLERMRRSS